VVNIVGSQGYICRCCNVTWGELSWSIVLYRSSKEFRIPNSESRVPFNFMFLLLVYFDNFVKVKFLLSGFLQPGVHFLVITIRT
jgi:hypothetical protein